MYLHYTFHAVMLVIGTKLTGFGFWFFFFFHCFFIVLVYASVLILYCLFLEKHDKNAVY